MLLTAMQIACAMLCAGGRRSDTATQEVTAQLQALVQSDPQNADSYMTILAILAQEDCTAFRARVAGQDAVPGTETGSTGGLFLQQSAAHCRFCRVAATSAGCIVLFPEQATAPTGSMAN